MVHIIGTGNVRLVEYYESDAPGYEPEPYRQFRFERHEEAIQWLCDVARDCHNQGVKPLMVNVVWPGHEHYDGIGWTILTPEIRTMAGLGNFTQPQPRVTGD